MVDKDEHQKNINKNHNNKSKSKILINTWLPKYFTSKHIRVAVHRGRTSVASQQNQWIVDLLNTQLNQVTANAHRVDAIVIPSTSSPLSHHLAFKMSRQHSDATTDASSKFQNMNYCILLKKYLSRSCVRRWGLCWISRILEVQSSTET